MIKFTSFDNPLDFIELPNPKFGDTHTINFKRINRTSRGNDLILDVPDANWTPVFMHRYDFEYLSDEKKLLFKAFVSRHVGLPVTVLGLYEDEEWKVIFLRPDMEFPQVGFENRTLSVDMQIVQ